ncbi:porin family protein [Photobacterium sp. TY1-4]|uniref:porin family protein n=1 Tax=Photobacterium sp. TY1-4 TaxID=2899122 RepID=UPI0021BF3EFD|nr:porin family protein [Photobacterium sp. TY1-4]UXI03130.1 porin family protein [Photobacterium sp. TY1-4]
MMKKQLLAAALALTALPASADILGLSVGATAGAAQLDYDGRSEYGYEYGVNASYQLNDFFSVNAGVVRGSGEVESDLSASDNDIDYTAVPVTFRGDLPLLIGSLYAKAGANYYDVDIERDGLKGNDDGWGFTGGVGFMFTLLPFIDLSLGYEYRDMGEVENNAILFGVGIGL